MLCFGLFGFWRLQVMNLFCPLGIRAKTPIGLLKVGKKKLFLFDGFGECFEVEPICVLDFYISTDFQRQGFGKELFEFMLRVC